MALAEESDDAWNGEESDGEEEELTHSKRTFRKRRETEKEEADSGNEDEENDLEESAASLFEDIGNASLNGSGDQGENERSLTSNVPTKVPVFKSAVDICEILNPPHYDITKEFADIETFLISADSLVIELASHDFLNWEFGGSSLVILYMLERFLQSFIEKGGRFKLVWFSDLRDRFKTNARLNLVRCAVEMQLLALKCLKPEDVVKFRSPLDDQYKGFVAILRPSFILIGTDSPNEETLGTCSGGAELKECLSSYFLLTLMRDCVLVVSFYGLDQRISSIYAFVQEPVPASKRIRGMEKQMIADMGQKERSNVGTLRIGTLLEGPWRKLQKMTSHSSQYSLGTSSEPEVLSLPSLSTRVLRSLPNPPKEKESFYQAFILYACLLESLPLEIQAQDISFKDPLVDDAENALLQSLKEYLDTILNSVVQLLSQEPSISVPVHFIHNGSLLCSVFRFCGQKLTEGRTNLVPQVVLEEFQKACLEMEIDATSLWSKAVEDTVCSPHCDTGKQQEVPPGLQSMNHKLLDLFVPELQQKVKESLEGRLESDRTDKDTRKKLKEIEENWISGCLIGEDVSEQKEKLRFQNNKEKTRDLRSQQNLVRWNRTYGYTLEGRNSNLKVDFSRALPSASGGLRLPGTASASVTPVSSASSSPQIGRKTNKRSKSQCKISKKDQIIIENQARMGKLELEKLRKNEIFTTSNKKNGKSEELRKLLPNYKKHPECETAIHYEILLCLEREYINSDRQDIHQRRRWAVKLVEEIRDMHQKDFLRHLAPEKQKKMDEMWAQLGFGSPSPSYPRPIPNYSLEIDLPTYLLQCGGSLIDVQLDAKHDIRVNGFDPDGWQRELLDVVDKDQSALIVAPTSAGKTFVSYYCMEKILRRNDDDVVVYVAPTKALVNQATATVYSRFCDKTYKKEGRHLVGTFTRDYNWNVTTCQVLITVPHGLHILLMHPEYEDWVSRIKYVIFDEVHCIGGGVGDVMGGEIWEHIIQLIPSPFLALSATIGNPQELYGWLSATENLKNCDRSVSLVHYQERYSELEIALWNLQKCKEADPESESPESESKKMMVLHPFAAYSTDSTSHFSIPEDLKLTAAQIFQLYEGIVTAEPSLKDGLNPKRFFKDIGCNNWLTRSQLREYENQLKEVFRDWMSDSKKASRIEHVFRQFSIDVVKELEFRNRSVDYELSTLQVIPKVVQELKQQNMLPGICFSDNRKICEILAYRLFHSLEGQEETFMELARSKEIKGRYDADHNKWERLVASLQAMGKCAKKTTSKKSRGEDGEKDHQDVELPGHSEQQPEEPYLTDSRYFGTQLDQFRLGRRGADQSLLEEMINRVEWKDTDLSDTKIFVNLLRRGVGYHHSGLTSAKRQVVEILFRSGHLGMVFSTSTLALGIHMPCRTVIFGVDSSFLTPLQFRQMSGRAGRRGFDDRGTVVFLGIPKSKIHRLLTASLPKLRGNIPFGTSLVLKLQCLVKSGKEKIVNQILSLLNNPFLLHTLHSKEGNPEILKKQLQLNFIFSSYFLRRQFLLDGDGKPVGLTGLVSRLHYQEPGNFMLAHLISIGEVRKLCESIESIEERKLAVMVLLGHLFSHRPLFTKHHRKYHNSKVILEPPPEKFLPILKNYNEYVNGFYRFFLGLRDTTKEDLVLESRLPLSEIEIQRMTDDIPKQTSQEKTLMDSKVSELEYYLQRHKMTGCSMQGPIFALNGNRDEMVNLLVPYLARPVSPKFAFDRSFLPAQGYPLVNYRGNPVTLNAYAVDFLRHGSLKSLIVDNGLMEGDAYKYAQEFAIITKTACATLQELSKSESDIVVQTFQELAEDYGDKFYGISRKKQKQT